MLLFFTVIKYFRPPFSKYFT